MSTAADPVTLTQALIRCESVTPVEGGALTLLEGVLSAAGFECHRMTFSEPGFADVQNSTFRCLARPAIALVSDRYPDPPDGCPVSRPRRTAPPRNRGAGNPV